MRIIIYGAGGVGGTLAGRLAQAGSEVAAIARGAHLEKIRAAGLTLFTPEQKIVVDLPVYGHPSELQFTPDDVVILCMKSQHTQQALQDLMSAAGASIPVVCCQNGVANESMASQSFERVYGMVVILPGLHLEPGVVANHATGGGILDTGCFPTGVDKLTHELTRELRRVGFSAEPDERIMRWKYAKLLMNLGNSLQAATHMADGWRDISRLLREEALACYEAADIDCATAQEVKDRRSIEAPDFGAKIKGIERVGGSTLQSIMRGTGNVESDYLNGEIVRLGQQYNVPTPANRVLQEVGNEMAAQRLEIGSFTVNQILQRIRAQPA